MSPLARARACFSNLWPNGLGMQRVSFERASGWLSLTPKYEKACNIQGKRKQVTSLGEWRGGGGQVFHLQKFCLQKAKNCLTCVNFMFPSLQDADKWLWRSRNRVRERQGMAKKHIGLMRESFASAEITELSFCLRAWATFNFWVLKLMAVTLEWSSRKFCIANYSLLH